MASSVSPLSTPPQLTLLHLRGSRAPATGPFHPRPLPPRTRGSSPLASTAAAQFPLLGQHGFLSVGRRRAAATRPRATDQGQQQQQDDSSRQPEPEAFITPFLLISLNSDGASLSRPPDVLLPPSSTAVVASKDIPLDSVAGTWLRLYRPLQQHQQPALPIVVFFHGGGFVLFSAASDIYHTFCEGLAAALPAVVASVEYRRAPEHRLPAAYDDAMAALRWLSSQANAAEVEGEQEELLRAVDYSRCFLMGSSSGANIVYHAGRWAAAAEMEALRPLRVAGHVYNQAYFGGVGRTASELAMEDDVILPLRAADMMWRLALPEGADRDHEFCNAVRAANKTDGGALGRLPRSLVWGFVGDPLIDRQREFVGLLRAAGVDVVARLDEDGHHAAEFFDPIKAQRIFDDVRAFVYTPTEGDGGEN